LSLISVLFYILLPVSWS